MQILAFTGSQGSGKTTLKEVMTNRLTDAGKRVVSRYHNIETSVSRTAKDLGFPINEKTTFETQYYLALRYMVLDIETRKVAKQQNADYIILDRSTLDVIPYTFASNNVETGGAKLIEDMLQKHFKMYPVNYLAFTHPLDFIEEASDERSVDKLFQQEIHTQFETMLKDIRHYPHTKIIDVPKDTVVGRVDKLMEMIVSEN